MPIISFIIKTWILYLLEDFILKETIFLGIPVGKIKDIKFSSVENTVLFMDNSEKNEKFKETNKTAGSNSSMEPKSLEAYNELLGNINLSTIPPYAIWPLDLVDNQGRGTNIPVFPSTEIPINKTSSDQLRNIIAYIQRYHINFDWDFLNIYGLEDSSAVNVHYLLQDKENYQPNDEIVKKRLNKERSLLKIRETAIAELERRNHAIENYAHDPEKYVQYLRVLQAQDNVWCALLKEHGSTLIESYNNSSEIKKTWEINREKNSSVYLTEKLMQDKSKILKSIPTTIWSSTK